MEKQKLIKMTDEQLDKYLESIELGQEIAYDDIWTGPLIYKNGLIESTLSSLSKIDNNDYIVINKNKHMVLVYDLELVKGEEYGRERYIGRILHCAVE